MPALPTIWSPEVLETDRTTAINNFVARRLNERDPEYLRHFDESHRMLVELFEQTNDLITLGDPAALAARTDLILDIGRFTAGPPVSADDFWTLLGKEGKTLTRPDVIRAVGLLQLLTDVRRFPWIRAQRPPTNEERTVAIVATASLRAVERARTGRRLSEPARQENGVVDALVKAELQSVDRVTRPDHDLPPGTFKKGVKFEGKQCDILVRLFDERFLALECKSSNSAVNSVKRLNDISEKEKVWRDARGNKVVTAGVLAGVFTLSDLRKAQEEKRLFFFWEHDLDKLITYISATK